MKNKGIMNAPTKVIMAEKTGHIVVPMPAEPPCQSNCEDSDCQVTNKMKDIHQNMLFLLEKRKIYLDNQITLSKLSDLLFTNTTYLSKVINLFFGCNLKTLLNHYRIEYAKELLKSEKCNVQELPVQCGFVSRSTFYAAFSKFEHQTPTDYRSHWQSLKLREELQEREVG